MRILILSFYYPPDLSAGSFRTSALITALSKKVSGKLKIDIVTTLPNRYKSFDSDAPLYENNSSLNIYRIELPSHKSGLLDQSRAFITYAYTANRIISGNQYDMVYATSSRLMTAVLGAWLAIRNKSLLYIDIRDIFVDTIKDVLPKNIAVIVKPVFSILEKLTINRADKVNLVSEGFGSYFESRYPNKVFSYYTNGIDKYFIDYRDKGNLNRIEKGLCNIVYAGNIGEGQGLHLIIPKLAKRMEGIACFTIIGDGGRKKQLEDELLIMNCENVELKIPVERDKLINAYLGADVLFLHLNDYDAFRKVLPSKLFEYAAMGKPVWAGVSGYAEKFVKEEIINSEVFSPCNDEEALRTFYNLKMTSTPRINFINKFSRENIMDKMVNDILSLLY